MGYLKRSILVSVCTFSLSCSLSFAAGTHPETGEKLAEDQTFTYRILDEHASLDPQLAEDVTGAEVLRDLFEGLYNQDKMGNLVPGVALSHDVSADKTTYTFYLRKDAVWSDGKPVTAHDFVFAWRRLASKELASPYAWFIELMNIENAGAIVKGEKDPKELGVKAIDDHTLQVKLQTALPYFPLMTIHASTFPSPQWAIEAHGKEWTKPGNMVSNGAYVLAEHVPQERSVRVRNEKYWNNDATFIEKVVTLVINDENAAFTRFLAGELDRTKVPTGKFPELKEKYPEETVVFPRLCSYYYNINLSDSAPESLRDKRVRQALAYAVDRKIITQNVTKAGQFPAFTFTPEVTAGFSAPEVPFGKMSQQERDEKARELLVAAGYGKDNPLNLSLLYNSSESHKKIAIAISQMWKQKLGVQTTLANMEWKTFLERRGKQDYEIARAGWCGDYNEASTFLDLMHSQSGYNDSKYNNPDVDRLLKEAKTADNPQENYTRIEQIIAEDMPIIPIYHYTEDYMMRATLKNWPTKNAEQNWYSKDLYKVAE
ncbi:peptide ABC transporter substrate-binding protein [Polycladidibacter stylochi]|uniref:peptide ABC transporter substrate-binding protein n=1 Tax=Polycladidibacter stylochi TaxID=1807766 RepID=UPI00082E7137|nr:peptide ABC transporter substrate-binding protein [Pseudovibrio stylochi]